ncbi:uncharacterized protein LOC119729522 isoform X2 [Patiria miniata]|nr:uncharacterized protein LOC119729522 isoform X2 [Patiria miniata]
MKCLRQEKGWHREGTAALTFVSTINGYHAYHNRPLQGRQFVMQCSHQSSKYDKWGCVVKAPQLEDVDEAVQGIETRAGPNRTTVADVAGKVIGHVPRKICNVLAAGLAVDFSIARAVCVFTGEFQHGGAASGGGPKLVAVYHLEVVRQRDAVEIADSIRPHLTDKDRLWIY